ncbi:hypothetical protein MMC14_005502 [Varicellaria rhodocarpa]|nr:hypothetical protein [Varicellaria rhodocarpa]
MRYAHPEIASVIKGENKVYIVPDTPTIQNWLQDTFFIENTRTATELFSEFRPGPLATIHYIPSTTEIAIHSSHWRIDGIGALQLLDQFFEALANPKEIRFGDEHMRLSPNLEEVLECSPHVSRELEEEADALVVKFVNGLPSIGLPIHTNKNQISGATFRSSSDLEPKLTSIIIASCKARTISLTTAVHAAIILITQRLAPASSSSKKYTSWCALDLRKYCPSPYNSSAYAVSVCHTGIPAVIIPGDFTTITSSLQSMYSKSFHSSDSNALKILDSVVRRTTALAKTTPPPDAPLPAEPMLSSLGFMDNYVKAKYDGFDILDAWLGVEMLTQQLEVYAWTWRGSLKLSVCYNGNFYEKDFVDQFLVDVKEVLLRSLELI